MSKFLTDLVVRNIEDISHDGRGSWQVMEEFQYQSDVAEKIIIVPKKFITDFASVPRIPIAFFLAGGTASKAAVLHDLLYTTHEVPKNVADSVLYEAAILSGVPNWRATLMRIAVARFGNGGTWDKASTQIPEVKTIIEQSPGNNVPIVPVSEYALA